MNCAKDFVNIGSLDSAVLLIGVIGRDSPSFAEYVQHFLFQFSHQAKGTEPGVASLPQEPVQQRTDALQRPRRNAPCARPGLPPLPLQQPSTCVLRVDMPSRPGLAAPVASGPTVTNPPTESEVMVIFEPEGPTTTTRTRTTTTTTTGV
ncbi:uncharacterized protein LOC144599125 isoform X1 [Rhinoraja longicauda]